LPYTVFTVSVDSSIIRVDFALCKFFANEVHPG
jgi:hypothetical protein